MIEEDEKLRPPELPENPPTPSPLPKKISKKRAPPPPVTYKYSEDKSLVELEKYLASTYSQHYAKNQNFQVVDLWEVLATDGDPFETHRNTALKYLFRYGKKNGYNRADLLKAIHYIFFLLHYHNKLHANSGKT